MHCCTLKHIVDVLLYCNTPSTTSLFEKKIFEKNSKSLYIFLNIKTATAYKPVESY